MIRDKVHLPRYYASARVTFLSLSGRWRGWCRVSESGFWAKGARLQAEWHSGCLDQQWGFQWKAGLHQFSAQLHHLPNLLRWPMTSNTERSHASHLRIDHGDHAYIAFHEGSLLLHPSMHLHCEDQLLQNCAWWSWETLIVWAKDDTLELNFSWRLDDLEDCTGKNCVCCLQDSNASTHWIGGKSKMVGVFGLGSKKKLDSSEKRAKAFKASQYTSAAFTWHFSPFLITSFLGAWQSACLLCTSHQEVKEVFLKWQPVECWRNLKTVVVAFRAQASR